MNSINRNMQILRVRFCDQRVRKTYFDNVRNICSGMEGTLARIKSRPIDDPHATLMKFYDIRVNRFIPLSDELQQLDKIGIKMPKDVHERMFRLEADMNSYIQQLERRLDPTR
jgi:hypothetical protein